jgi:hypothetical protein
MENSNFLPKIQNENPFSKEIQKLEESKSGAYLFYSLITESDNEINKLLLDEIVKFEEKLLKPVAIKKRSEVLFQTKEKYYQKLTLRLAKYLSLECADDPKNLDNLNLKKLKNVINMGFREIFSVFENDIPLYDKLFTELDSIRETDKKVELYIGRDGIYAYEGRRAIDIARRKKKTKEEKAQRKLIEIHPKYINYNSFIKNNFDEETKIKYLQDQGVDSSKDLIIFDTGYRGSIPEQILRSIGFSQEEIEKRIKILGTDFYKNYESNYEEDLEEKTKIRNRLVKEIPYDLENYNKVARIEERPKRFMTSTGLYFNKKGKLTPIEAPFLNEISFHYDLIELTIRQYYFNREYFEK